MFLIEAKMMIQLRNGLSGIIDEYFCFDVVSNHDIGTIHFHRNRSLTQT